MRKQNDIDEIQKCDEIIVGDWCLFRQTEGSDLFIVGYALQCAKHFREKLDRATWKKIEYKQNSVLVTSDTSDRAH